MKIIAHRGSSGTAPENTMLAFRQAIADGADGIETDVRKSKDGVLFILHDNSLQRVAGDQYKGLVATEMTYDELKDIDISSLKYPDMPAQHIVKLEELLQLVKESGIELNIEIKQNNLIDDRLENDVVKMVHAMGVEDKILYSCFDHQVLANILEADHDAKVAPLYSTAFYCAGKYGKTLGASAMHPEVRSSLLRADFKEIRDAGLDINVWTVNTPEDARALAKKGATGLITNYPALIRDALK